MEKPKKIKINRDEFPKMRDPNWDTLQAKGSTSGVMDSWKSGYDRNYQSEETANIVQDHLSDNTDEEKELKLKQLLLEIDEWAGDSFPDISSTKDQKEKARLYIDALAEELKDDYYNSSETSVAKERQLVDGFLSKLQNLI